MRVSEIGEFALIDRLACTLGAQTCPDLVIGIGDDAAVWRTASGALALATTDALVEDVHFDLRTTPWEELGWKALAENISDIAAMGGRPRYALVALGLPGDREVADIESLYRGMRSCGTEFGCCVVGGDVVRSPVVSIHVTVVGDSLPVVDSSDLPVLERSRAQPGDAIAVTGPLGGSAGGLRLLTGRVNQGGDHAAASLLRHAHLRPMPRVAEGLAAVEAGIRCGMDVSDGLVADVNHICERSGVDALIDAARVPRFPGIEALFGGDALDLALAGGEDYELVCVAPAATLDRAQALFKARGLRPLIVVGSVAEPECDRPRARLRMPDGTRVEPVVAGYEHFRG
ncbi:MAG TPA: thiamine-phosphate kinase [Chloroflexota bacterium]|nr:thiamine-phosphate kinase [Chloroflexota bacterium]